MKLISACLCGVHCKYNGGNNAHPYFISLLRGGKVIPVCPEQLGGLATPRLPCEIQGGGGIHVLEGKARVLTAYGEDKSAAFIRGAQETLLLARETGAAEAILKSRSPSCGVGQIYDGSFSSRLQYGDGVTTALLKQHGLHIISDEDIIGKSGEKL